MTESPTIQSQKKILIGGSSMCSFFEKLSKFFSGESETDKLQRISEDLGLTYVPKANLTSLVPVDEFRLFSHPDRIPYAYYVMYGDFEDYSMAIFNYSYMEDRTAERTGKQQIGQTVALFSSKSHNFPRFCMDPGILIYKPLEIIKGLVTVEFEKHKSFSKWYVVEGEDENEIRKLFTEEMLNYFSKNTGFSIEASENKLVVYWDNGRLDPEYIPLFFKQARTIFSLFV